jgi:putative transposase
LIRALAPKKGLPLFARHEMRLPLFSPKRTQELPATRAVIGPILCLLIPHKGGTTMPRKPRFRAAGIPYHVVNRGNDRKVIFRDHFDNTAFMELLAAGARRVPVRVFGYCAMRNHFHLLIQPETDNALSAYMEWVTGRYACTFRQQTETLGHGHVFQRRFWSAPVQGIERFILTLRYIEANPPRAQLVAGAEEWEWSSLTDRAGRQRGILAPLPLALPDRWVEHVNTPLSLEALCEIRKEISRKPGRPRRSEPSAPPLFLAGGLDLPTETRQVTA